MSAEGVKRFILALDTLFPASQNGSLNTGFDTAARGHGPKIATAIASLKRRQEFPDGLRPVEAQRRIIQELLALGYSESELPSRDAIARARRRLSDAPTT